MKINETEAAIEAILFAMGDAVEAERIAVAIGQDADATVRIIRGMMERYGSEGRGIRIIELDGSFQMCSAKEMNKYLIKLLVQPKRQVLTDVTLETLSIIAYKQPVTKLEIEHIRGVKSDHAVNRLIEYGLIEEVGRKEAPGRPILFGTGEEFLRRFGLTSLKDLPPLDGEKIETLKLEAEGRAHAKEDAKIKPQV